MESGIDRKQFIQLAGAGIAGGTVLAGAQPAAAADPPRPDAKPKVPPRPVPDGPNVLVILLDSLRYDHVGHVNAAIQTPHIDALARESLRFTRAFPEAMPTVPARRSLMTGRRIYPWTSWRPTRNLPGSPGWTGLGWEEATWLRALRRRGYWTGYVTDNPFLGFSPPWKPLRRGVDRFMPIAGQVGTRRRADSISLDVAKHWLPRDMHTEGYVKGMRQHLANLYGATDEREQCCARVFTHAAELVEAAARKREPFALVVDSFDPHEPWAPVRRYRDMYGDGDYSGPQPGNVRYRPSRYLTSREMKRLPELYAAAVTQTDAWLGHFLQRFYATGVADDTVVVFLSDHGIVLGDRGWTGKPALELHPSLTQVPFMIRAPDKRRAGQTSAYFASPHDIGPTLMTMTGTARPEEMDGSDLSPLLAGRRPAQARPFWFGGYANHWYYRDDRWAMISDGNNTGRSLFDLRRDAGELDNIAADHLPLLGQIHERVLKATGLRELPYFGADDATR